jgi:hypothetical protein
MEEEKVPAPPREGVVYGEIAYWFLVAGVLIAIVGLGIYLGSPGYIDKSSLLSYLWSGSSCQTIWKDIGGSGQVVSWFSSIKMLHKGDMLATLGIAISGFGAVFGMWGATFQMFRGGKRKTYLIFALIIAIVLTLSALGIISLGD